MKAGRPNLTVSFPEVNAFVVGQLIYLLEVATVAAGGLLEINPLDQPGVEGGKKTTYGLLGRPGYELTGRSLRKLHPSCQNI
jgi:glucose-6-phosphate isomerase